ncbi:MAG: metalloregulator ArsR/SmtB family transcription factor [Chloroflexota bacterium]|nr:metalloregulator ArsR/SmtB family transcription factor [Chloroflexota bacterium]
MRHVSYHLPDQVPPLPLNWPSAGGRRPRRLPAHTPPITSRAVVHFKALADRTRLTMLAMLAASPEPLCVCEFQRGFDLEQPTISHHLRVLREAELIRSERRGNWVYHWLDPRAGAWIRATLATLPD